MKNNEKVTVIIIDRLVEGVFETQTLASDYCKRYGIKDCDFISVPLQRVESKEEASEVFKPLMVSTNEANFIRLKSALLAMKEFEKVIGREGKKLSFHFKKMQEVCDKLETEKEAKKK